MKKPAWIVLSVTALAFLGLLSIAPGARTEIPVSESQSGAQEAALPASLDAFFPPQVSQPVYLLKMIALGTVMSGIIADLMENDLPNAVGTFANFKTMYTDMSQLVPEWRKFFPLEPLDEFGNALKALDQSKDMGRVMAAAEKFGQVCMDCHSQTMVKVQQKYHWKNFREITAKDPLSGQQVDFLRLMQTLGVVFSGSWMNLGQGQRENAQKQFQGFQAVFQALTETCEQCHGQDVRKYYVDAEAQTLLKAYGQALGAQPLDMKKAEGAMMSIGEEICLKCHLVHVPAAYSQRK